ncbi:MAG: hypothetical protein P8Y02_02440 [Deinococcales bacterium]
MGVGVAAFAADGVDALHHLAAVAVEEVADEPDQVVLADAGAEVLVEVVVGGVDHAGGVREQADLVDGLDLARLEHHLLAVDDGDARLLQGEQHGRLDDVDGDGVVLEPALLELVLDPARDLLGAPHLGADGPPEHADARAGALLAVEPGRVELVVLGGAPEVPQDGLVVLGEQREAGDLVLRPGADVGRRDVADVVHVEAQERSGFGRRQHLLDACQAFGAEALEVDAFLPVDRHDAVCMNGHANQPPSCACPGDPCRLRRGRTSRGRAR